MTIERMPIVYGSSFNQEHIVGTINLNGIIERLLEEGTIFYLAPVLIKLPHRGDKTDVIGISIVQTPPTE